MKQLSFTASGRKRLRRAAHRPRRLGLERLEQRLALASISPVSLAYPAGSLPVTGDGSSNQAAVSADGRYVVFLSDAANLVEGQVDTLEAGVNLNDVFLFDSFTNSTTLVSHAVGSALQAADKESDYAVISADGKYIAYASRASNLDFGQNESAADGNVGLLDLFLYDVESNRSVLVSHNSLSLPTPANGDVVARRPAISADGRYVAFASSASNMVSGVNDGDGIDVFLYDRLNPKSIRLVSRSASSPQDAADAGADEVTLSANGQFVAFQSFSSDLVPNQDDRNGHADIFLYDVAEDSLHLVTGMEGSDSVTANGPSFQVASMAISAHGRYLAFRSFATDLVAGQMDNNNNADVFLFDRLAATNAERLRLVSHDHSSTLTAAAGSSAASDIPVMNVDLDNYESNGDGLFIAYQSTAQNLVAGVTDNGNTRDLFLYDVGANRSVLVSHAAGLPTTPAATFIPSAVENELGKTPVISRSGRYVAYSSPATDLVPDQADSTQIITNDVFRYDRLSGNNSLLSGANGSASQTGDSASNVSGISADGLTVAFSSLSTDLIGGDDNLLQDVFVSVPDFTITYTGRQFDLLSADMRNMQDGVNDALFTVTRRSGLSGVDITDLELRRGDGRTWSSTPDAGELALGTADSILGAINSLKGTTSVGGGGTFLLFAADSVDSLFTVGERFTWTAHFSDGSVATVDSDPIPASFIKLAYNGKLRDRVGRDDAALGADGQKDGTFTVTFPFGSGILTSLELDQSDGNFWNSFPHDGVWVLGAAHTVDSPLINRADGSLVPQGLLLGEELILFAPEDRPEAPSFFTAGKSFQVFANFQDGSQQVASVTLSSFNVPPPQPDLTVNVTNAPNTISPGEKSTYSVTVKNTGDGGATNVQVRSNPLPSGVQFVTAESPANCEQLSSRVVCTLDGLAVDEMKSVDLPFTFDNVGTTSLSFEASATETDANPLDNSSGDDTRVVGPLQITLSDSPDPVHVGEDLTYEITVTNPNATAAADVFISSPVPGDSTFVSVSTTLCRIETGFFQCNLDQLDPAQTLPFRFVVRPTKAGTLENLGAVVSQSGLLVGNAPAVQTTIRPANDDFAARQLLTGAQGDAIPGSNVNATGEALGLVGLDESQPVDPAQVTKSIWYEWTPSYASGGYGSVTFDTAGSNFDTLLGVYTLLSDGRLRHVASNDDVNLAAGDRTSKVNFNAIGGLKHFIAVDGYRGAEGSTALSWREGPEFIPGPRNQVITSVAPPEVNAGTGAEVVVVRGIGFTAQTVGFVNGERRPTAVVLDGAEITLAVELSTTDKAYPGVLKIQVGIGDAPELDHYYPLPIGNFSVKVEFGAGQTGTSGGRRLLAFEKPEPITTFVANCDIVVGNNCSLLPKVYRSADLQYCDAASLCWPTLRQFQIAHDLYCDFHSCKNSLDEYRATHNGQDPVDTARPGALVGGSVTTLATEGALRLGSVMFDPGTVIPAGAMLIGNDGASLIGNDGASLLDSLRLAGLIGNDGASLIGNDGASLIGNDGASLIGNDGASFTGNGEGEQPPAAASSGWFVLHGSDGNPATITDVTHPDGTTTSEATVMLDAASLAQFAALPQGMVFAVVMPDKLQFSAAAYTVSKNGGEALITVTRTGTSVGRVTVMYATEDDTATVGEDYTATSGMLTFESGEMSKTISVPITNGTTTEQLKLKLTLSMPGGIVRLGAQTTAELSITAPAFPWQNPRNPLDANVDDSVSPIDALVIINELNDRAARGAGGLLPAPPTAGVTFYYDTSGDGIVSPIDVLLVINFLNDPLGGESESAAESPASAVRSAPLFYPAAQPLAPLPPRSAPSAASHSLPPLATVAGPTPASHTTASDERAHDDSQRKTSLGHDAADDCDLANVLFALFEDWNA